MLNHLILPKINKTLASTGLNDIRKTLPVVLLKGKFVTAAIS